MFDWLGDLFTADTFNTIAQGAQTAGSAFNSVAPYINAGASLAAGLEGTRNARNLRGAMGATQQSLESLFSPTGTYAQELRKQLERKDAAAGRRSQYGTRETELMAALAKQQAATLGNPQYAAYLRGANMSPYAPLAGAVGNLTGGQQKKSSIPNTPPGTSNAAEYLLNLFGPGSEASVASLGGAGTALGEGGLGSVGSMGAEGVSGLTGTLPSYAEAGGPQASGIFGDAGTTGAISGAGNVLGGLGGAGSALSGMGAGSLAGTVGGLDTLGALAGGTGFLPGYGATASGIFGGGAAGAGAGGAAGGAAAGGAGASGAAGAAPAGAMGVAALPFLAAILGMTGMFDSDVERADVQDWQSRAEAAESAMGSGFGVFTPYEGEDFNTYRDRAIKASNVGTSQYDPASEPFMRQYYDRMQNEVFNNPDFQAPWWAGGVGD